MAKIVVTGAFGFIGRAVVERMVQDRHDVVAVSRFEKHHDAAVVKTVDYTSLPSIVQALKGAEFVIHLADTSRRTADARHSSAKTARFLGQAMSETGVSRLIYSSSVYARVFQDQGVSSYGADKLAAEAAFLEYPDITPLFLRLPPVYGPGGGGGFSMLAKAVSKGIPLPIGAARAPRDYIARSNVVDLIGASIRMSGRDWQSIAGQALEPSDGTPSSTANLAKLMGQAMEKKARVVWAPEGLLRLSGRLTGKSDIISGIFDSLLVKPNPRVSDILGWTPKVGMPDSLAFLKDD